MNARPGRGAATLVLSLLCGATCQPPPDSDGLPMQAAPSGFGHWQRDRLDCGGRGGDCADWRIVELPGAGSLEVDVALVDPAEASPAFALVVADEGGLVRTRLESAGQTRLRLREPRGRGHLEAGRYRVGLEIAGPGEGSFDYELRLRFEPRPRPVRRAPPGPPPTRAVEASLLEIESRPDGGEAVLLDRGSRAGIAPGQRGRLLLDGEEIAEIEVLDVYPDGCRALIRGSRAAAITPDTVAEVDVPL